MKLLDRITQQMINSEELLHLNAIIPQRYVLAEDWKYTASYIIPKGTILFAEGSSIRFETTQNVPCVEVELTETVQQSIIIIAQHFHQILLQQDFSQLPNPLIPSQVFDSTAQLTELESMLDTILEAGHLHQIAHRPRMDMRYDEELVDISRAKKIANNAHRHLAIHSETWQQRTLVGIHPKKILARLSEDEIAIYENKVFVSLLDKLRYFLASRLNELQQQQQNLTDALHLGDASITFYKLRDSLCQLWAENLTDEQSQSVLEQLESTIDKNKGLLERIKGLQSFGLYVQIPVNLKRIPDQLHKTNILTHDQHYRHLSRLWSELYSQQRRFPNIEEKLESFIQFQNDYNQYSLLIILRAFLNIKFSIVNKYDYFILSRDTLTFTLEINDTTKNFEIISQHIKTDSLKIITVANTLTQHFLPDLHQNIIIFALDQNHQQHDFNQNIIWASPFNFRSIEHFTVLLLKWMYQPLLQAYSKNLNLGRIPQSVKTLLNQISALEQRENNYQLIDTLNSDELNQLKNICDKANTMHIYDEVVSHQNILLTFKKCPICTSDTHFEPRPTNQTFIAQCLDPQCAVQYKLVTNKEGVKTFSLDSNEDNLVEAGRWKLNFQLSE
ncbi:MAG TPA: hypothetical protein PLX05_12210 [Acinetobacter parvus]|jgi:hypothetical protein|uniref:DUF2357 domain-containing protein n=1 Tax=Acinetobacter parvus NIPH 1103 TaxID=1217671 RepID=N8RID5_9GAMM|nr:hypothetical protein [Acinetobacter parvus]ENU33304.1 hypothetical protein F989_01728 [Acinetobacter parvus NIPH 1103]HRM16338.1 hypothetical protein [Acinetobacter parvus]